MVLHHLNGMTDDEIQTAFNEYGFTEPMMTMDVIHYEYIVPATLQRTESFAPEETRALHSLRHEDCHECSRWCDS